MRYALDLFCSAGGASVGLARAGFEVHGVDLNPQPNYPFAFMQGDALDVDVRGYDLVWASPPCQRYSSATRIKDRHPELIGDVRRMLRYTPHIIENVPGAPLINPITLCGAMFGLGVIRHRHFEASWPIIQPQHVKHKGSLVTGGYITVAGNGGVPAWTLRERERRGLPRHRPGEMSLAAWSRAMGINWMTRRELTQAIPPAYSQWIGRHFL